MATLRDNYEALIDAIKSLISKKANITYVDEEVEASINKCNQKIASTKTMLTGAINDVSSQLQYKIGTLRLRMGFDTGTSDEYWTPEKIGPFIHKNSDGLVYDTTALIYVELYHSFYPSIKSSVYLSGYTESGIGSGYQKFYNLIFLYWGDMEYNGYDQLYAITATVEDANTYSWDITNLSREFSSKADISFGRIVSNVTTSGDNDEVAGTSQGGYIYENVSWSDLINKARVGNMLSLEGNLKWEEVDPGTNQTIMQSRPCQILSQKVVPYDLLPSDIKSSTTTKGINIVISSLLYKNNAVYQRLSEEYYIILDNFTNKPRFIYVNPSP